MAVHGYISLRDSSPLTFGDAVSSALRRSGEGAAHASGERTPDGWLIRFHKTGKDGKAGKAALSSWLVSPNNCKRG